MMSWESRSYAACTNDLFMDVSPNFYPLPSVAVFRLDAIPYPLEVLEEEYDFISEQRAVAAYECFHAQRAEQQSREQKEKISGDAENVSGIRSSTDTDVIDDCTVNAIVTDETESANCHLTITDRQEDDTSPLALPVSLTPMTPLEPQRSDKASAGAAAGSSAFATSSQEILKPQPVMDDKNSQLAPPAKRHWRKPSAPICWDDFTNGASATPFDALQVITIDDKALLQQILQPNTDKQANICEPSISAAPRTMQPEPFQPLHSDTSASSSITCSTTTASYGVTTFNNGAFWPNHFTIGSSAPLNGISMIHMPSQCSRSNLAFGSDFGDLPATASTSADDSFVVATCDSPLKPSQSSPDLSRLNLNLCGGMRNVDNFNFANQQLQYRSTSADVSSPLSKFPTDSGNRFERKSSISEDTQNLDEQQRRVFDLAVGMGFSSERIVRCLSLGVHPDIQNVLNFVDAVDTVSRANPSLPTDLIEQTVHTCNMDTEKALQFARVGWQLCSLGFASASVCAALQRADGRRDVALEELLRQ